MKKNRSSSKVVVLHDIWRFDDFSKKFVHYDYVQVELRSDGYYGEFFWPDLYVQDVIL